MSLFTMPRIIYVSKRKRLFDAPDNKRKLHTEIIPNLGGIGIFFSFMTISALMIQTGNQNPGAIFEKWNYFAASCLILFLTGIKDDLITIAPKKKLVAQIVAAAIVVIFADVRLQSLHGFLGLNVLPTWFSIVFSIVGCVFLTNAFNLIDGIDGLAGTIGMLASFALGILLYFENKYSLAILSFALMGAIGGFLYYNYSPAKIFMGDTGSMVIGFSIAVISIMFIRSFDHAHSFKGIIHSTKGSLIIALSFMFIPVFDTFRVFATRIIKGNSPFKADRTHLHHYLLDLGFSHQGTVGLLFLANLLTIVLALLLQDQNINLAIGGLFVAAFLYFTVLFALRKKMNSRKLIPEPAIMVGQPMGKTSPIFQPGLRREQLLRRTLGVETASVSQPENTVVH